MNIKNVVSNLERLISMAKDILGRDDNKDTYQSYVTDILKDTSKELTKEGFVYEEDIKAIYDEVKSNFQSYHTKAKRLKPYAERLLNLIEAKTEELRQYIYQNITINDQYYKAKTVLYDEQGGDKTIRYIIASFYSEQEMRAMLSNLQKGYKKNQIGRYYSDVAQSVKNGYRCIYSRTQNENIGDGVHAIIYNEDERVLKVHQGENPVEKVYKFLSTTCKTGLIPEWQDYFYNTLSDGGLIYECEGFDYTGKAPKVLVLSEEINDELILKMKQEGLRSGKITLPVENNVVFNQDATFYELVTEYVIPHIQEEEVHYKVGDPIDDIISSPIDLGNGKTGNLYPRQQVIAQGMLNAIRVGKRRQILNGDMGIGKTFIGAKLGLATIYDIHKSFNGRMAVYCQGQLIKKWQREITQVARPLGVEPHFIEITNFKDVKDLPLKPNGLEVLLLPKDKVKRSYQQDMSANERYSRSNLAKISKFIDKIGQGRTLVKDVIIENANNLPSNLMKYTALQIEKEYRKPVILYKEQLDENGKVKSYKIVTPSKIIKSAFGKSYLAYDFELSKPLWKDFIKKVREQRERLTKESENKIYRRNHKHNGLTCPVCGGFIYPKESYLFDDEKCYDNLQSKPKNKSKSYSKCNHYIKADGTPLMDFEIKAIKKGYIGVAYVDETETIAYVDAEGNPLVGNDLIEAKANKYAGSYKINIRKCDAELWSAVDKKGYRVVNSVELMKKYFGKGYIDICVADEAHLYNRESNQGLTYHTLIQLSKVMINLTGTLTGGKSSDIFYQLVRLYPDKLKRMGYTYNDVNLFIDHYGRRERVTKEKLDSQYNKSGKGRRTNFSWVERAGISPLLYTNFLSGIMVSRSIEDMQLPMPELKYYKHEVDMSDELKDAYDNLKKQLVDFMNENKELPLGGTYLHNLLAYPDYPQQPPIYWSNTDLLVANPKKLELNGKLLPKEQRLVDTIKSELAKDRKVLVYSVYSGEKGVSDRLMDVLHSQGFKAIELKSSVPVEDREDWIEEKHQEGFEVIVTNPSCVQTGLNIIQFPSIYFYECGYDIKVLRQAERRAWRVNQPKTCKIFYSYYKESLQEDAMKLIGGKKKSSLALEGVFSEDLLSSMSDINDNGAKMLFDVLKGKITLKENELDAFGFEDEDTSYQNETVVVEEIEQETEFWGIREDNQLNFFTLTKEDVENLKDKVAKKRNVAEGQMTLFAM
jgi:hypothetical protein